MLCFLCPYVGLLCAVFYVRILGNCVWIMSVCWAMVCCVFYVRLLGNGVLCFLCPYVGYCVLCILCRLGYCVLCFLVSVCWVIVCCVFYVRMLGYCVLCILCPMLGYCVLCILCLSVGLLCAVFLCPSVGLLCAVFYVRLLGYCVLCFLCPYVGQWCGGGGESSWERKIDQEANLFFDPFGFFLPSLSLSLSFSRSPISAATSLRHHPKASLCKGTNPTRTTKIVPAW